MPGVPDYVEISFDVNSDGNANIFQDIKEDLGGREVYVRISKAHDRDHLFTIIRVWKDSETGRIMSLSMTRKRDTLPEPDILGKGMR